MWPVSICNSWHGSKLFTDDDIPEIREFKEKYIEPM